MSYGGRDVVACYNISSRGSVIGCELLCTVWIYIFSGLFCLFAHSHLYRLSVVVLDLLLSVVLFCSRCSVVFTCCLSLYADVIIVCEQLLYVLLSLIPFAWSYSFFISSFLHIFLILLIFLISSLFL